MLMLLETSDEKLSYALAQAKIRGPEIAAQLHSAFHDGKYLPEGRVEERIRDARQSAERLLLAIAQAEQAIAPATTAAPANDHLEAFPGEGAYTA